MNGLNGGREAVNNSVADALANFAMDLRCNVGWQADTWSTLLKSSGTFNVVAATGGDAQKECASAGWALFLWRPSFELPLLAACREMLLDACSIEQRSGAGCSRNGVKVFSRLTDKEECFIPHSCMLLARNCIYKLAEVRVDNFDM